MASSKKRKISYKCPFCTKRYLRENLPRHLDDVHKEEIPEGFSPLRYTFHYVNKRPLDYHGRCTECKGPTPWDEEVGRYKRQCGKQACHDSYVKKFEENMVKKTGHTRNTDTEEGLQNMLKNRKISGKYKFQNGKEKEYVGSYEKNCLEFMDKVMNIDPDDIMSPGPTLEYQYDGKTHYYITDFYYVPYNLIIEVKDGGKNPNKRNMPEYREKQIAKEKFIVNNTDYNYLRLTDNNLAQLLAVFADLKMQLVDESNDRVVHINETAKVKYKKVYYGLTETESKKTKLSYKGSSKYTHKGVNVSLNGLKKFVKDSNIDNIITKYTVVDIKYFDVDDSVIYDEEYDMIAVHIPFEIPITNIHDLNVDSINEADKNNQTTLLFHGSCNKIEKYIEPRNDSQEEKDYVFATPYKEYALFFAGKPWHDGMLNTGSYNDKFYIVELKPNMLKEIYDTVGYLYTVDPKGFRKRNKHEYLSEKKAEIFSVSVIKNVYKEILNSDIDVYKYPNKPTWWKNKYSINESSNNSYSKKLIDDKSIELVDKKYTKHLRVDKNTKGYFYFDKENFVGVINTEKKDNGEIWIQGLEVSEEYKKQGVGTYLLKEGERLGAKYLSVNKKNTIAFNMYKKNGWKVFEETDAMYFMSKGVTVKESFIIENTVEYKVHDINDPEVLDLLKKDSYCKKYLDYISKNTGTLIVDTDNNKIIGYSFIGKNSDKGFIATIEVHKSYRRQGFGDILVDDAVKKHDAVDLLVLKSNKPAISLYKKHDFVVIDDSVKANGKPAYWMKHKSKLNKNDKVIPLDEATKINLKNIYFISIRSDFDGKTLSPRVPDNYFTKNGYEDNTTKRICFCPTIDQCLTALSKNCTGMEAYVYQPDDISKYDLYRPTINEVPDVKITGEVWITEPVKVKCIGKIHCTGDTGEDGIEYIYGDNKKAKLYKWNWEWVEQLNEGYVINQKDILYNKDKFESGEINLCFVTGHSGSGKSTYTYKYAEDRNYKGVDVFSLDDLQWSYKYSDENLKEYGELAYKFFNGEGKRFRIPYRIEKNGKMVGPNGDDVIEWFKSNGFIKDDPSKNTFYQDSTQAFIKFAIKYAKSHKNTKYIVEGIQLFLFIEPSEVKDYAVYIKGTSALISTIRGTKRDSMGNSIKDFIDNMDTFFRRIKDVIGINNYETKINKWRKYFTDLEKKEAVRESKLAAIKENGFAPVDFI